MQTFIVPAMLLHHTHRHGRPAVAQHMRALLCAVRCPALRVSSCSQTRTVCVEMAPKHAPTKAHYSSHLQVFNVDNSTAAPSVLLIFDNKRYLFNAGEGIQRHFIEYKQKMNKITSVLATRVSTDTLAGLPGMLLSQVPLGSDGQEETAVKSAVYGPEGVAQYCSAFRQYASSFKLDVNQIGASSSQPVVTDQFVSITAVPLALSSSSYAGQSAPAVETVTETTGEPQKEATAAAAAAAGSETPANGASVAEPAAKRQRTESGSTPAAHAAAAADVGSGMSRLAPVVLCYVCQLATIPGKLDPQKCAALGVPRGPLLGQLQRGVPVTLQDGTVIQPHQAMATQETPGACLVVVDCPSLAYLTSLQSARQLQLVQEQAAQQQQQQPAQDNGAAGGSKAGDSSGSSADIPTKTFVVVHLGPSSVTSSEPYRSWLSGFGPAVEHLLVSSDGQLNPTTQRAAILQAQLNAIEPQVFSLQGFQMLLQQQQQQEGGVAAAQPATAQNGSAASEDVLMAEAEAERCSAVQSASNGFRYTLAPFKHQGPSLAGVSSAPDLAAAQDGVRDVKRAVLVQLLDAYTAAKAEVLQQPTPPQLQGIGRRSAELTLLGTCSACPSNHRNVSSYYLDLFGRGGLLMDCGEDTMGQLERRFGRAEAAARILGLNAVWVSHMHADHHGGLYPLLLRRQRLQQQQQQQQQQQGSPRPLVVLGPWPLFRALCEYSKVLDLQFQFLTNTYFYAPSPHPPPAAALEAYEAAKAAAGLTVLQPFPVQHVAHSTGLILESKDGWKIVFSGDTRPCQSVIDAAKGATLLVHEATFEDELQEDAIAKKHSTTSEALGVAAAAGAYRTVLTHFSSRYPKIPVMKPPTAATAAAAADAEDQQGNGSRAEAAAAVEAVGSDLAAVGSVVVGFDLMSVNVADLPWLPKTLPVLDELFKEEEAVYQQDDEAVAL